VRSPRACVLYKSSFPAPSRRFSNGESLSSSASDGLFPAASAWARSRKDDDAPTPPAKADDASLMARVQASDEAALGELLERYARLVLGIGYRILRDSGEAQELVQDVFLHVYRKAHIFDPQRGSFRTWVIRIACSRALNRRQYLNLRRFYDDRNLDDYVGVFQAATNLDYQVELGQCGRALQEAFEELNEKQRKTVEMYFFEGYTLREISVRLNDSLGNTRHYYYRAMEKLRANVRLHVAKGK
jgi:RNA polymerase sigma-70 factor, ECF subfamily